MSGPEDTDDGKDAPEAAGTPPGGEAEPEAKASQSPGPEGPPAVPSAAHSVWGRLFRDAQNIVTVIGAMIVTAAAVSLVVYFTVDVIWGFTNRYASLVVYLLLPGAFVAGLALIPIGIWRTRLHRARVRADERLQPYPVIDFNDRRVRLTWSFVIGLTFLNIAILGVAAYKGLEYTDSVEFCGDLCHSVMNPQRVSHADSPHARVPCVDCHIGAGASWFVQAKLSGLRQVWAVATGSYSRPIPTPVENLRPARETCEACHWPQKFYGDRFLVRTHFASDETNTHDRTALLVKTGGGDPKLGLHGGIHWFHMEGQHEIRFIPADRRQQSMAFVRYRTPDGEVFEFTNADHPPAPGAELRVMDCVTCHNQPTHGFKLPSEALDDALALGRLDPTLPFLKREALAVVSGEYASESEARRRIESALLAFYRLSYPDLAETRADAIRTAIRVVGDVWARNVFPEMKITWGTYPDNVGHPHAVAVPDDHEGRTNDTCLMCHATDSPPDAPTAIPHVAAADTSCLACHAPVGPADRGFPGCFRCHNDRMTMTSGPRPIAIATTCDSCHLMTFLGQGDFVVPRSFLGQP
ncbi:MAG: NapC/NirT family cytochrome c [Deltaproteobacteria bacterium]|nr:NapC/NirT family cytochrome c [Deltaproteobacteria bacterium]